MSYYILPKNINEIDLNLVSSDSYIKSNNSYSLLNFYLKSKEQIENIFINNDLSDNFFYDNIIQLLNPYEYLYKKVEDSLYSVSKLPNKSHLFYDLYELINSLNLFDSFNKTINTLHISKDSISSIECNELVRENMDDNIIFNENLNEFFKSNNINKFEYIYCELDTEIYVESFVKTLKLLLINQSKNGFSIIKIADLFDLPIIHAIYFLSSLYDKVYICKPSTSNIITFEKYIVCKNFKYESNSEYLNINLNKLSVFLNEIDNSNNKNIVSLMSCNIPYYFKNKLDDINIIFGQQQLESIDHLISIYKNKNKNEKIENIKKNNIQKSVIWCEKYKIPCNKFTEKTNIFLPISNETA